MAQVLVEAGGALWDGQSSTQDGLGAPVVPFCPFSFWVPLLKPNSREKGTLIIKGLLGNLVVHRSKRVAFERSARITRIFSLAYPL